MSWKPGQHLFPRFQGIALLDNHLFTIASACDETYVTAKDGTTTRRPIVFFIKPKDGITKNLMRLVEQEALKTVKVNVEGPYGGHDRQMELPYQHIILLAGGSGITSVLPLLTDLARKIRRERTALKEILLIWVVKDRHSMGWIQD